MKLLSRDSDTVAECLQSVCPPSRVLHIGVGSGSGGMHIWRTWPVERAWLIDANPASMAWMAPLEADHPAWRFATATLAAHAGSTIFYHASNPGESGLIPPAALRSLWPNLEQLSSTTQQAVTLDSLVTDPAAPAAADLRCDWLLVDCLTSLAILHGAADTLQHCGVVWLRTLRAAPSVDSVNTQATILAQLRSLLEPVGFRLAYVADCNHPALAEAIFVRDWHAALCKSAQENQASAAQAAMLQEALAQALRREQEHDSVLGELQVRLVQLEELLDQQQQACRHQATSAGEAAAQCQTEWETLAQQHMQDSTLLQDRITQLIEDKAALSRQAEDDAQAVMNAVADSERRCQDRLDSVRQEAKQQGEADIERLTERLHQLEEELIGAAAQIDLIKDVLLRDPAS
ncbi:hypothetical protein [Massilia genomosp. 1]|uniref:Uncharacterized protein n=1 Tax=Massilia genomosp. 1 TaxID=2609280 RepID=A0ABX0MYG9_9BURK|nr:hypothetical protein [Massilia genomosp. 1]NHZ64910.1 hypothetical protein [Massilia genomosp. 1]